LQYLSTAGAVTSSSNYSIPGRTSQKFSSLGTASTTVSGSLRIVPAGGGAGPAPQIVFSYKPAGITVAEAGATGIRGTGLRSYVESSGASGVVGSIESGFSISNTGTASANVTLELTGLDGSAVSGVSAATLTLPASG